MGFLAAFHNPLMRAKSEKERAYEVKMKAYDAANAGSSHLEYNSPSGWGVDREQGPATEVWDVPPNPNPDPKRGLTDEEFHDYNMEVNQSFKKASNTGKLAFVAAAGGMGLASAANAGLLSSVGSAAPAASGAVGSVGGELTAGLTQAQIAALGEGIAGSSSGAAGLGGAFSSIPASAFTGAGVVGSEALGATGVPSMDLGASGTFNAAADSQMANVAGVAGTAPGAAIAPSAVDLGSLGGVMSTGAVSTAPAYTTAAADSQAANAAMQAAGTPAAAATAPAAVDLGSAGGVMSTGGAGSLGSLTSMLNNPLVKAGIAYAATKLEKPPSETFAPVTYGPQPGGGPTYGPQPGGGPTYGPGAGGQAYNGVGPPAPGASSGLIDTTYASGIRDAQTADYNNVYRPVESRVANDAMTWDSAANQEIDAGKAGADVQRVADAQRAASDRSLASMGVDPSSTRFAGGNRASDIRTAAAKVGAQNAARLARVNQGVSMRSGVVNTGRNVLATGTGQDAQVNNATATNMQNGLGYANLNAQTGLGYSSLNEAARRTNIDAGQRQQVINNQQALQAASGAGSLASIIGANAGGIAKGAGDAWDAVSGWFKP